MKRLALVVAMLASPAFAQSAPAVLRPPKSDTPPVIPLVDAQLFLGGIYSATVNGTNARLCVTPDGQTWQCMPTVGDVASSISSANAAQDSTIASTYMPTATANAAISGLSSRLSVVESSDATQAAAISALQSAVGVKRACATFTVAAGLTVPLTGISTVINVPLAGVPVGTSCDAGAPSRMPLGARPDPVVTTAGAVNMAFVSNAGLLSSIIAIPSGTYRVCCDL